MVVQLVSRVRQRFGLDVPVHRLFTHPTLSEIAATMFGSGDVLPYRHLVAIRSGTASRPLFLVHPGEGEIGYVRDLAPWITPEIPVYGIAATGLLGDEMPMRTIDEMAARYLAGVRYVQPSGPYRLGGWSAGGTIAYEMARQLLEEGQEVEFVALIDTLCEYDGDVSLSGEFDELTTLRALVSEYMFQDLDVSAGFVDLVAQLHEREWRYSGIDAETLRRHLLLRFCIDRALVAYRPVRLDVPVTLVSAVGEQWHDVSLGWKQLLAPECLRIVPVNGTHYSIMETEQIHEVGAALSTGCQLSTR
jgi:thioesterase domain-containing protein